MRDPYILVLSTASPPTHSSTHCNVNITYIPSSPPPPKLANVHHAAKSSEHFPSLSLVVILAHTQLCTHLGIWETNFFVEIFLSLPLSLSISHVCMHMHSASFNHSLLISSGCSSTAQHSLGSVLVSLLRSLKTLSLENLFYLHIVRYLLYHIDTNFVPLFQDLDFKLPTWHLYLDVSHLYLKIELMTVSHQTFFPVNVPHLS